MGCCMSNNSYKELHSYSEIEIKKPLYDFKICDRCMLTITRILRECIKYRNITFITFESKHYFTSDCVSTIHFILYEIMKRESFSMTLNPKDNRGKICNTLCSTDYSINFDWNSI